MAPSGPELLIIGFILGVFVVAIWAAIWASQDAQQRTGNGAVAAVAGVAVLLTFPVGLLAYLLVRQFLDTDLSTTDPAPGASAAPGPAAGWYDNLDGEGKRYWNGQAWTEHTQS